MFAEDFVSYINSWSVSQHTGLDDLADRANFHGNVMALILCTILVSVRQYFMTPMICYVASVPGGSNAVNYLSDMCWVEGTVPLNFSNKVSHRVEDWDELMKDRMNYYQWVPFVLGLQAVLFYLPRLMWQMITYNRAGMDLEQLVRDVSEADGEGNTEVREKIVEHVARNIEIMLFGHRQLKSVQKKDGAQSRVKRLTHHIPGKRNGNYLIGLYLIVIKLGYLVVGVGQLWMMYIFLRLDRQEGYWLFGHRILENLLNGKDWSQTQIFPRVGMCRHSIEQLGNINRVVAQCLLPINMLNEKIYVFLFFFMSSVLFITVVSIILWVYRILSRRNQVSLVCHSLKVASNCAGEFDSLSVWKIDRFVVEFLRQDGNFILRMMSMNVGDMTTSRLVQKLYSIYVNNGYINCDLRNFKKRSNAVQATQVSTFMGNGENDDDDDDNGNFKKIALEKTSGYARVDTNVDPDNKLPSQATAPAPAYEENPSNRAMFML